MSTTAIPVGTSLRWASSTRAFGNRYLGGGAPWRLVKLSGLAVDAVARWREGDVVRPGEERLARSMLDAGLMLAQYPPRAVEVDVVIPYAGHPRDAEALAHQLAAYEVTVVRDGRGDRARVRRLIDLDDNGGPARARNRGAAVGHHELLLFIDDDISLVDPHDVVSRLAAHFDDPQVVAVAPRIVGRGEGSVRDRFEEHHSPLDLGPASARVHPQAAVAYVPSAVLMVRREAFDGFDESLRTGEDVDFIWRLIAHGGAVIYDASVVVTHRARPSWSGWWRQRVSYGESASVLAARHPEAYSPLRADAVLAAGFVALTLARPRAIAGIWSALEARFVRQLPDDPDVARELARFAMWNHSKGVARALTRSYLPLVLVALWPRRTRRMAIAIIGLSVGSRLHRRSHPRDAALVLADDLAYVSGVWRGAWRQRSLAALRPSVRWPSTHAALRSE